MSVENLHFMVAEDHHFQRSAMVRLLHNLGALVVHEAMDGQSALRIVGDSSCRVDIIISDLDMPGMDGMEFLRHLGEARARVSIILASALEQKLLASIATMSEAYGLNLLGVVEKPLTREKLEPLIALHRTLPAQQGAASAAGRVFSTVEISEGLRNGEFEPFFQPKMDLASGLVKGVETLARWRHPHYGVVSPAAFIGPMESNDLIGELTMVMLRKSALYCKRWRTSGLGATVSVNLSPKSLNDTHLAERVIEAVVEQGLDPAHMVLELTESAVTTDIGRVLENLARLRMKGFGLSIDDYGTGYSSIQQLTRIAFTELKIDQSFVANAAKQKSARVILESSLDMAKKLNIVSVGEGVESEADWNLLRELGCDLAQGYFISRPMDYPAFLGWVRQRILAERRRN